MHTDFDHELACNIAEDLDNGHISEWRVAQVKAHLAAGGTTAIVNGELRLVSGLVADALQPLDTALREWRVPFDVGGETFLIRPDRDFVAVERELSDPKRSFYNEHRIGVIVTDRPEYGWASVRWLYEDFEAGKTILQPYGAVNEARWCYREGSYAQLQRELFEQQQAEIRAETNIPQHLVW